MYFIGLFCCFVYVHFGLFVVVVVVVSWGVLGVVCFLFIICFCYFSGFYFWFNGVFFMLLFCLFFTQYNVCYPLNLLTLYLVL